MTQLIVAMFCFFIAGIAIGWLFGTESHPSPLDEDSESAESFFRSVL